MTVTHDDSQLIAKEEQQVMSEITESPAVNQQKIEKPKPPKANMYQRFTDLHDQMRLPWAQQYLGKLPTFARRFATYHPEPNKRLVIEIDEQHNTCEIVGPEAVEFAVAAYLRDRLASTHSRWQWHENSITKFRKHWLLYERPIEAPQPFAWADEKDVLAFHRLPWNKSADSMVGFDEIARECPTWADFLSRMSNARFFCKFVGSLFYPWSDRQQYLFMYGEGGDGKGAVFRFLGRVFGRAYLATPVPEDPSSRRFFPATIIGKRLVVFPECDQVSFLKTPLFKQLTGGDSILIDPKGVQAYSASLFAKYMLSSNTRPLLTSDPSLLRRVIYCEMEKRNLAQGIDGYEDLLWEEGGRFISICMNEFMDEFVQNPRHITSPIVVPMDEKLEDVVYEGESDFHHIAMNFLNFGEGCEVDGMTLENFLRTTDLKHKILRGKFLNWIAKNFGVTSKRVMVKRHKITQYYGVSIKPEADIAEIRNRHRQPVRLNPEKNPDPYRH